VLLIIGYSDIFLVSHIIGDAQFSGVNPVFLRGGSGGVGVPYPVADWGGQRLVAD